MSHTENLYSGGIRGAAIVAEAGVLEQAVLHWRDGFIDYIGTMEHAPASVKAEVRWIDAHGGWVLPGFIDLHVHGGGGSDFMEADIQAYKRIAAFHARNGTTGMLPTTLTAPQKALTRVLETSVKYRQLKLPYAEIYGVHLEGPFISHKWPGAQNPEYIATPNIEWLADWENKFPGTIRIVTLAPELPGALALIRWLRARGIVASCGHTDATYEQILLAADAGLIHAAHTFNAMRGFHHREPGAAGAVLTDNRISAEVIADGLHVHPAGVKLLAQAKLPDNLILITDAISAAGLGDGEYRLGGLDIAVISGAARLKAGGALAGSTLTMIDAFRNVIRYAGLTIPEASRLASGNPARQLGVYQETGSLQTGKNADLLLLDSQLNLLQVWKKGVPVPSAGYE